MLNITFIALLLANYLVFQFGSPFLSSLLVTYVHLAWSSCICLLISKCASFPRPSTTAGCILGSHMLLNLRAMADNARVRNDPATPQPESVDIPLPSRRTRGESNPSRATFDLTSGRLTSIPKASLVAFDLDRSRVAPFESTEPKNMSGPGRFVGN